MKKKKGAKTKEPNPLSVKKKKKVTLKTAKDGQVKEKKPPVKEQEGKVELMRAARDTRKRQRKRAKKSGSGAANASGKAVEA